MYPQATLQSLVVNVNNDVFHINIDAVTTKYKTKNTSVADRDPHHFSFIRSATFLVETDPTSCRMQNCNGQGEVVRGPRGKWGHHE